MNAPRHPREAALLATVFLLVAIEFLHTGMIAFAASPIMGEISASPEEFTMITASYAVVAIAAIACTSWLVERLGWRSFVQGSVALFVLGAAISAGSAGHVQFMAGRIVMALGGAAFMTMARLLINLMPPSPRRFLGIKMFGSALAIGTGASPWLAAYFVSSGHWYGIFVLLSAMAVLVAGLAQLALPDELVAHERRSAVQPQALAILLAGCLLSVMAIQRASYDLFADALPLLLLMGVGSAALVLFVRNQVRQERPMLLIKRLAQRRYLSGLAVFFCCYVVLGANGYMLPMLMQRGLGFPWEVVGNVQAAGLIMTLPVFWLIALIVPKRPAPKKFYLAGFGALALSAWQLTQVTPDAGLWTDLLLPIAAFGLFIILVMSTTALHTFSDLQGDNMAFNHGQQLKNMLSQLGIALGVSAAALGTQWRTSVHAAVLNARFNGGDTAFNQLAGVLGEHFSTSQGTQAEQLTLATLAQQLNQQAALLASIDYFSFLAAGALLMCLVMGMQRVLK